MVNSMASVLSILKSKLPDCFEINSIYKEQSFIDKLAGLNLFIKESFFGEFVKKLILCHEN